MSVPRGVGWAKGHRNALVVAAMVCVVAGADLLFNRPKDLGVQWFSLPLLAMGFGILALIFWPTAKAGPRPAGDTLARRLLWRLTFGGRLVPFLPVVGLAIIVGDLAFNAFLSNTPALLTHDQAAILFGAAMVAYPFVPARYARERDFVFLFSLALALILVVPLALFRLFSDNPGASVDVYSTYALAPQTSGILNLIGVRNDIVINSAYDGPGIHFWTAGNVEMTVFITSACSGIYSVAIFSSAFAAYVLTEQRKLTLRVEAFFALGIFLAYVANVLRMVVIVWVGYRFDTPGTDMQNLLFAHSNIGWIIFLAWVAVFWFALFKFLSPEPVEKTTPEAPRRRGTTCGICGFVLTPAIPATRCVCGALYHVECLDSEGRCPQCQAPPVKPTRAPQSAS